jgi:hypothetical protein
VVAGADGHDLCGSDLRVFVEVFLVENDVLPGLPEVEHHVELAVIVKENAVVTSRRRWEGCGKETE